MQVEQKWPFQNTLNESQGKKILSFLYTLFGTHFLADKDTTETD